MRESSSGPPPGPGPTRPPDSEHAQIPPLPAGPSRDEDEGMGAFRSPDGPPDSATDAHGSGAELLWGRAGTEDEVSRDPPAEAKIKSTAEWH